MTQHIDPQNPRIKSEEPESKGDECTLRSPPDPAELKQTSELLRRSEEHFRSLIENASDIITIVDLDGTIRYESPSVERVLGFKPEDLVGTNAMSLSHPDDAERARRLMLAAMNGEDVEPVELRFRHKDGSWITLEVVGKVVRDGTGTAQVIVNSRDISERKRSEEEKFRLANHVRLLMDSTGEGIYGIDLQGTCTFINRAATEMLRYESEGVLGRNMHELIHHTRPDGSPYPIDQCLIFRAFMKKQGRRVDEEMFWRRDGTPFPVEYSSFPIIEDEVIQGAVVTFVDITERKSRERELLRANTVLNTEQETSLDGILVVNQNHEMVSLNKKFVEMWGLPDDIVQSRSDEAAIESVLDKLESPDEFLRGLKQLYATPQQLIRDELKLKDGRVFDRYSAPMIGADSTYYGRVFYFRDITQGKRADQALRESEAVFRSLAETVAAAIYIYRGSKFIYVNPAAETITGYTHEELMGMEVWNILHPNFVEDARKTSALRQNGEDVPAHSETQILTKDGETRWLDITPSLIRFQGEQAILATAFDVTDRKGWEDALRESEEKYRTILENIQEGYYEVDLAGNLTFFNDSLCRIVGSSRERLKGLNNREYTDAGTARRLYEACNQVYRSGEPLEEFKYEIVTRDGAQRFLETSILLRRDKAGLISGFRGTIRDITERTRSEEALRESEERYRLLFERNLAGVYRASTDGVVLDCNEAAARILGYGSKQDAISHSMWEFYYDMTEREALVQRLLEARSITNLECRARTKDGKAVWVLANLSLLDGSDGAPAVIEGTLIDITARKHAEDALRESEQRYKTLFDAATDGIVILSTEGEDAGRIVAANKATAETTGYTADELLKLNISDLLTPEYKHLVAHSALPEPADENITVEVLRRRKDGSTFPVEINAGPLRIGDENYVLGFARDITERKHIEKEVTMLAQAIRSIRESVCITDSGDALLFVNDAFLRTYGYERHEVIGKNIFDLVRLPANSEHDTSAIPSMEVVRHWEGELINRRKDGSEFPIHLSSSPIVDETGETIALIGVIQDITESKSAIEELQNAKEIAETASRAKSEFLANMSHEIRTPMNGIIGMTDLALDTELTAEQSEYLKMVKMSADSLLGVINDVLDFSKIEAGKLELDPAEFNLQDAVDEVMKALAVRADQKHLELAYYLRPGVPEKVVGDVGRLRQILVNLVGNAIKFTQHGEVVLRVDAQAQTSDDIVLHFGVRDTGIGVPPEKQTMIFESFTQADGSTTREYGGTGLGLTISSQLVRMMGGRIWVESPLNLPSSHGTPGSRFNFTGTFGLPVDSVSIADRPTMLDLANLPVLVVDDNATNRKILEVQLSSWHMKPLLVDGARSALLAIMQAASAGTPFRLLLLDFHMPEMDGLALAEKIRSQPECRGLRIIMMSSSVQQNHASPRDLSIDASLLKPVRASELLSVIRGVMGADAGLQKPQTPPRRTSPNPSRVLVAEDSLINQELIRRLLEKWGHTAVLAEDGQKALALFETEEFDLVLMDLQMPRMNGFEVTAAIRQREDGRTRIPIIALTAHALKGDRERCIAAGMDDYVSKPIDAEKLFDIVERTTRSRGNALNETAPKVLDLDGLMRNFDGDAELVLTLAKIFGDSSIEQVRQIGNAIARGDADALARAAHSLKGAVANFGARAAVDAAVRLEGIAKGGDLSAAGSALMVLEREIDRLKIELQMFEQASVVG